MRRGEEIVRAYLFLEIRSAEYQCPTNDDVDYELVVVD
jgi:hypothetical protein